MMDAKTLKEKFKLTDEDLKKPLPWPQNGPNPSGKAQNSISSCSRNVRIAVISITRLISIVRNAKAIITNGYRPRVGPTLYAFAVNEVGVPFPFMPDLPYVTALIDLKEGPRMLSTIVECDLKDIKNGMELEVVFEDVSPEYSLPKWRPVKK